jgi:hypothetical protein
MQEKGLGAQYGILGPYRVCLTAKSLSLLKMGCKDEAEDERSYYKFSVSFCLSAFCADILEGVCDCSWQVYEVAALWSDFSTWKWAAVV